MGRGKGRKQSLDLSQLQATSVTANFDEEHRLSAGQLQDPKHSVFNRKQQRKQKKQERKSQRNPSSNKNYLLQKQQQQLLQQQQELEKQQKLIKKQQMELEKQKMQVQQEETVNKQKSILKKTENKNQSKEMKNINKKRKPQLSDIEEQIRKDEEEIANLEKKLGVQGKKDKLQKELAEEGFEEDLFGFLDNIEQISRKKAKTEDYLPFRDIEQEQEIDQGQFFEDFNLAEYENDSSPIVYKDTEAPKVEIVGYDPKKQDYSKEIEEEKRKYEQGLLEDSEEEDFEDDEQEDNEQGFDEEDFEEEDGDEEDDSEPEDEYDEEDSDIQVQFQDDEQNQQQQKDVKKEKQQKKDKNDSLQLQLIEKEIQRRRQEEKEKTLKKKAEQNDQRLLYQQKIVTEKNILNDGDLIKTNLENIEKKKQEIVLSEDQQKKKQEIYKTLNSNINKLSETNIDKISQIIFDVFENNPKSFVAPIFGEIYMKLAIEPSQVFVHLLSTTTAVLGALHDFFGDFMFSMVMKFMLEKYQQLKIKIEDETEKFKNLPEDQKDLLFSQKKNLILAFCHLYVFGSVSIDFIRGLFEDLIENINEFNIEYLIILIQYTGHKVRADSPVTLKHLINTVKTAIESYMANNKDYSLKVEFVLMLLNDIKNNKKLKSNPIERLEFLITWYKKNILQKFKLNQNVFALDLKTALIIDKNINKWWLPLNNVETMAKIEKQEQQFMDEVNVSNEEKKKLEALAIQNKFVTVTRKSIFMIIMSADDFLDASQKLMKLKLNKKQSLDLAMVLTECCANEKKFNPYYVHLARKLVEVDKNLKYQFQYTLWDKYKQIDNYEPRKIGNLAKFTSMMCLTCSLNLSVIKFFNLELPSQMVLLYLQLFLKDFYSKVKVLDLSEQLRIMKENDQNVTFVEIFREFLKYTFLKQIQQEKTETEEQIKKQNQVKKKVSFTIKILKSEDFVDDEEETLKKKKKKFYK